MPSEQAIEAAAIAAHEVNRAYCAEIGDSSHLPWLQAPEALKESARAGVRLIINRGETGPEESHKAWMAYKQAEGWSWGPVKDAGKKTHPCLLPWSQLPQWHRAKDVIFGAVVRAVLDHYEFTCGQSDT